jgi:hypothetical protein
VRYLLALLAALVVADGLISQFLVTTGLGRESNPFLLPLMSNGSFIIIKVAGGLSSALLLWYIYRRHPKLGIATAVFFVGLYAGILWWNLAVFFIVHV